MMKALAVAQLAHHLHKPWPSNRPAGRLRTRRSLKNKPDVSPACWPIFSRFWPRVKPGLFVSTEQAHALGTGCGSVLAANQQVAVLAVADEDLAAVDDVAIPIFFGCGADGFQVAAAPGSVMPIAATASPR